MKILLSSHVYPPSIGGIETFSHTLAQELFARKHQISVVTAEPRQLSPAPPWKIIRRPSFRELFNAVAAADIFLQSQISLRTIFPGFLLRKPIIVVHHTWLRNDSGEIDFPNRLKRYLCALSTKKSTLCDSPGGHTPTRGFVTNVCVSQIMADDFSFPSRIIPLPLKPAHASSDNLQRTITLGFLGRLVSDKGVDTLIEALGVLKKIGKTPDLSIIGDGPERSPLEKQCHALGLADQVRFLGRRTGQELTDILHQIKILVVPSRWSEPFGLVALEGIAAGCVIIGSNRGGLPEAIGKCGLTFANCNSQDLSEKLEIMLSSETNHDYFRQDAQKHLARFSLSAVVDEYERLFSEILNRA
ncbi:MAG: glycosyltransferase family 4 protein [Candidatus Riflebacteria bacterium]|nr:glycosyltransferase family 4 protein [Candidatus Riflebacteria bacterium]